MKTLERNGNIKVSANSKALIVMAGGNRLSSNEYNVTRINMNSHRSVGKAVVYGVAGGALTGGLGLVAGAAIGGRRRGGNIFKIQTAYGSITVTEVDSNLETRLSLAAASPNTHPLTRRAVEEGVVAYEDMTMAEQIEYRKKNSDTANIEHKVGTVIGVFSVVVFFGIFVMVVL